MSTAKDEDKHRAIMAQIDEDHIADAENREAAIDDLQFKAGGIYQWDADLYQERVRDGRPTPTINLMLKYVHQITNDARQNRPSIKVRGVDDDADPKTAAVLEGITRNIEDQCEAVSQAYIPGIDNAASCGIGNWMVTTEYADSDIWGTQDIKIVGIPNAMAVIWDHRAKNPTRADAEHVTIIEDISTDEYKERWPDAAVADFENFGAWGFWTDKTSDTVRIGSYWCKEPYDKTIGRTADNKSIDLTDIPAPSVKFLGITETRKVKSHKVVQYIISGAGILEGPNPWAGSYLPVVAVTGEEVWIGAKRIRSGIIRPAKDPQRLYNLWRALRMEHLALQPKSPYIGTAKQFEKYKDIWKQANKRNLPYLPFDPDPAFPNAPQRSQPPIGSEAMMEEAQIASEEMKATTGIYDAALGNKSNETSGVAIQNRQRESDVSNAHFQDNLALAIRHTGRILIDLIPSIYDTERVVRLLNEDGTEDFEHINKLVQTPDGAMYVHDLSVGKYDVTVKTGPSYQTRRMEAADSMMAFIQAVPEAAQFTLDLVAKNMDWPGAEEMAKRFRMMLLKQHPELVEKNDEEEMPPPSESDHQNALMMQAQLRGAIAETQLKEAQAEDAEMDAALKGMQVAQLAAQGPINMAVNQAVMEVLQKFGISDQGQPGPQGSGATPAPQPQPVAAPSVAQ